MNKELLRKVVRAHFELTQAVIQCLPENIRLPIKHFEHECMTSVHEVLEPLLHEVDQQEGQGSQEKTTGIKAIKIN